MWVGVVVWPLREAFPEFCGTQIGAVKGGVKLQLAQKVMVGRPEGNAGECLMAVRRAEVPAYAYPGLVQIFAALASTISAGFCDGVDSSLLKAFPLALSLRKLVILQEIEVWRRVPGLRYCCVRSAR
jgi:hypothetical protein